MQVKVLYSAEGNFYIRKIASCTPQLLPAPHQWYKILLENYNLELLLLHFSVTAALADVGGEKKGSLTAF